MDTGSPVSKLQLIILLDSICFGLLYGFIPPYILSLGGDHVVLGIMAIGNLIGNLLSADIINNLTQIHGKQYSLFLVFNIAIVSHLLLILSNSYWCTIIGRYIFCGTNQSQNLCKDILLQNTPKDEHDYFLTRFSILSSAGYIIGPIIGGYLFTIGFVYIGILAAVLTLANSFLILTIPKGSDDTPQRRDERSFFKKSEENIEDVIQNFRKSDYNKNWDVMAIKFLYIASITVFFTKFTQILKHNFKATAVLIGYTGAYMNSLKFAGEYFATTAKDRFSNSSIIVLTEYALIVAGAALLFALFSPVYSLYAIMCIPIIFSTSFIGSVWKEVFSMRGNDSLEKINIPLGILAGLTVPLIFGVVCNVIGHYAVIIFSVIPIIASVFIVNKYIVHYELFKKENEKSKDE